MRTRRSIEVTTIRRAISGGEVTRVGRWEGGGARVGGRGVGFTTPASRVNMPPSVGSSRGEQHVGII